MRATCLAEDTFMIAHLLTVALLAASLQQLPTVSGQIQDSATHAPVAGVVVLDVSSRRQALSDSAGHFTLFVPLPATLRFARFGYATREGVAVTALRGGSGGEGVPISQRTLSHDEIERRSFGQEVPLLLQGTPSVTSYAETGNYWGYSYTRLRGIDQSRINL